MLKLHSFAYLYKHLIHRGKPLSTHILTIFKVCTLKYRIHLPYDEDIYIDKMKQNTSSDLQWVCVGGKSSRSGTYLRAQSKNVLPAATLYFYPTSGPAWRSQEV